MSTNHRLRKPASDFTMVPNSLIRDARLTLKAKGIYALLFSKPDDWRYIEDVLLRESKDGRDAFRAGVKELLDHGWLVKRQVQDDAGKFSHTEWVLTVAGKPGDGLSGDGESAPTKTEQNKTEKPSPLPPAGAGVWEDDDAFMRLAGAYAKVDASRTDHRKAWDVWVANGLKKHVEQLLHALPVFAASKKWKDGYVPALSRWLVDGGWRQVAAGYAPPDVLKEQARISKEGLAAYHRVEWDRKRGVPSAPADLEAVRVWQDQQGQLAAKAEARR